MSAQCGSGVHGTVKMAEVVWEKRGAQSPAATAHSAARRPRPAPGNPGRFIRASGFA